jgi:hypothetical protein
LKPFVNDTNHVACLQQKIAGFEQNSFARFRNCEDSQTPPINFAWPTSQL